MITFTQFITFFMIALGLSFDSFAVSITMGMTRKKILFLQACQVAFVLAFFQALFPLGGWLVGSSLKNMIANYDHWVAFGLLTVIGVRMILDGLSQQEERNFDPFNRRVLIGVAVATSIDALAVGISFGFIDVPILIPVAIIGVVTFVAAMLGLLFGKKIPGKKSHRSVVAGGIILILIGIKILVEHLMA